MPFVTSTEVFIAHHWDDPDDRMVIAVVSDGKGRKFVGGWPISVTCTEASARRLALDEANERMKAARTVA